MENNMKINMEKYEIEHKRRVRELSSECILFLKHNGDFPLDKPCKVALYGNTARKTIKGGTGSGDVNVRHYVSVEEGLEKAGFTITSKGWLDKYDALWNEANKAFRAGIKKKIEAEGLSAIMLGIGAIMQEPEYELPLDGDGDTAIYVLGRISGEGSDRSPERGNLELTETEIRDILRLEKQYERFVLVLNVGGVVDLSPIVGEVSNILVMSQLGMAIGDALADVILGKSYPSGKLATTWASWNDYCHEGDFGNPDDTRYKEGIYVGYRYFDSVGKAPAFPFGFGIGYTSFEITAEKTDISGSEVTVIARVTNVGSHLGKEVVQLYVSIPEGRLDQPYQVLAAFSKTEELKPGESQDVTLRFKMEDIASFDEETYCAILEKGSYVLRIGNSSRDTVVCAVVDLDGDAVVQKLNNVGGKPDFVDWKPEKREIEAPKDAPVLKLPASSISEIIPKEPTISKKAMNIAKNMTDSDLALLCTGAFNGGAGSNSVIGNAGITVAGAAGETTGIFAKDGIAPLIMADGPAGLRLTPIYGKDENGVYPLDTGSFEQILELIPEQLIAFLGFSTERPQRNGTIHEQYCTAIPIATALAQSWSEEVCEICGDIVAEEMERFGVHIWLAPAMNIHRLPLCGRNFEYFSEDPLISGKMAAAITKGVQKHPGCGVSIKHFCCNNQETNRMHSNSIVSQRALRDIYLKGFRIAVDESDPATIMSSYNLLNGEHTSSRYDLLETLLRGEWGYKGIVMSDWVSGNINKPDDKYPGAIASGAIKAGNDIMMPGTEGHHKDLLGALNNPDATYPITRGDLERCAARMIDLAFKLNKENVL